MRSAPRVGRTRQASPAGPPLLRASAAAVCLALLGTLAACTGLSEKPAIVVTTNILGDVVKNLVGDAAEVTVLMKPNADPHSFGISAQEAGEMERADLIVGNGLGLEEGLTSTLANARSAGVEVLEVGERTNPLTYEAGEEVGSLDPHFWTDPARMITAADVITEALRERLGDDVAEAIAPTAEDYRRQLVQLDSEIEEAVVQIPLAKRKLVTNHHVFGYFADRFGFEVIGAVLPSGAALASPSAADLDELARTIEEAGVSTIFADSSQPQKIAEALVSEIEIDVEITPLYSESLSDVDGEAATYIDMQRTNVERIAAGLAR